MGHVIGMVWAKAKTVVMAPETIVLMVSLLLAVAAAIFPAAASAVLTTAALMVMIGILWLVTRTTAVRDVRVWATAGIVATTALGLLMYVGVPALATSIITANAAVTAFLFADYNQRHARMAGVRRGKTKKLVIAPTEAESEGEEDEEVMS